MRIVIFLVYVLLLLPTEAFCQPVISYLIADNPKGTLQLHGAFPTNVTEVTVDGVSYPIEYLSDTLIIIGLPFEGQGSQGRVIVRSPYEISNPRMLSVINADFERAYYSISWIGGVPDYMWRGHNYWSVRIRADLDTNSAAPQLRSIFGLKGNAHYEELSYKVPDGWVKLPLPMGETGCDSCARVVGNVDHGRRRINLRGIMDTPYDNAIHSDVEIAFSGISYSLVGTIDTFTHWIEQNNYAYQDKVMKTSIESPPYSESASISSPIDEPDISVLIRRDPVMKKWMLRLPQNAGTVEVRFIDVSGKEIERLQMTDSAIPSHDRPVFAEVTVLGKRYIFFLPFN